MRHARPVDVDAREQRRDEREPRHEDCGAEHEQLGDPPSRPGGDSAERMDELRREANLAGGE
jgi:hypothetical protein